METIKLGMKNCLSVVLTNYLIKPMVLFCTTCIGITKTWINSNILYTIWSLDFPCGNVWNRRFGFLLFCLFLDRPICQVNISKSHQHHHYNHNHNPYQSLINQCHHFPLLHEMYSLIHALDMVLEYPHSDLPLCSLLYLQDQSFWPHRFHMLLRLYPV